MRRGEYPRNFLSSILSGYIDSPNVWQKPRSRHSGNTKRGAYVRPRPPLRRTLSMREVFYATRKLLGVLRWSAPFTFGFALIHIREQQGLFSGSTTLTGFWFSNRGFWGCLNSGFSNRGLCNVLRCSICYIVRVSRMVHRLMPPFIIGFVPFDDVVIGRFRHRCRLCMFRSYRILCTPHHHRASKFLSLDI